MIRLVFAVLLVTGAAGCSRQAPPPPPPPQAAQAQPQEGEKAPYRIEGDVVKVNNRLCAVSHSPMAENTLGQFVSRVKYDGPDQRFAGKTLEFNQCCGMCIEKFPSLWAANRDGVMKFHGLQ